ncbi:MFS transporter [Subtercola boreus]|uniref:MFS transporter n=1 Tax=Subtercola boreus TaxID=120213 RepID=A0A3E0VLK7_9MICO|nr:MFS transporter [Subtercola boreus]RFA10874.1 MFS transporter [Subtercola boreus]TQL55543.1 sugar transport protein [Subtercola boreus]
MTTRVLPNTTSEKPPKVVNQAKRASLAGFFGATLEYYDMYIYASAAALVFGRIFFPESGAAGLLLALATYGVAYLARPLGGFVAGHFGDRFGRRNVLVATLLVMGVATFLIGCLPSFSAIGIAAPILLVLLRLLQGFSVGGEASGSAALTLEHAPEGRRGLYISWMLNGIWVGYIAASFAFLAIATMPQDQLLAWGWRIPFWSSAVIVVFGLIIRRTLQDPEIYVEEKANDEIPKAPIKELLRTHTSDVVRVIFATFLIVISTVVPVYGLAYATNIVGIPASTMLWVVIVGYVVALVLQPLFALLSDLYGRKPVMIIGNIGGALSVWLFFWAVSEQNIGLIYVGILLTISLSFSATNAIYPVFFSEMFNVKVRVSGMAIGLQLGIVVTGFSPTIITALASATGDSWWPAATFVSVACVISAIAIATARETYRVPLEDLGRSMA